jgi:hypothetical protein
VSSDPHDEVLVPLKMVDGFEAIFRSLEKVLLRPERISYMMLPGARSNADENSDQIVQSWSFKPP